jgi:hypothetical protein
MNETARRSEVGGVFPAECESCKRVSAYPYLAATKPNAPGVMRVAMRCRSCHGEWAFDMTAEQSSVREPR